MEVISWISWDRMCQTKNSGGRGVTNLDVYYVNHRFDPCFCKWLL